LPRLSNPQSKREREFQRAKRKNLFRIIAPIQLSVCSSFILSTETRKIPKTASLQFRGVFFLPSQQEDWKGGKKSGVEHSSHSSDMQQHRHRFRKSRKGKPTTRKKNVKAKKRR
jgi:hypothetical protein